MLDLALRNCRVLDGTGAPWFRAEVGISGDKIVRVTKRLDEEAFQSFDLEGQVLCPGFIDMHTHSDLRLFSTPEEDAKIMQGITTAVLGQDGLSVAPLSPGEIPMMKQRLVGLDGSWEEWSWNTMGEYLSAIDRAQPATNSAMLVPHGAVRASVVGWQNRPASGDEIREMVRITGRAMEEGAFGFSTGLIYPPCLYAEEKEFVALAREAAAWGGFFVVHMRNEQDYIEDALNEVITICTKAECPLHISHLKIAGKKNWGRAGRVLQLLDNARSKGLEVTFDQYPYTAGSTMLDALIPPVFHADGQKKMLEYIGDPSVRQKIREMTDGTDGTPWENWVGSCGWDGILINSVGSEKNRWVEGKNMAEIAAASSMDPVDALCDLLVEEAGTATMTQFYGCEEDVETIISHESMLFCSDSIVGGKPHPRAYGSTARILGRYVRERGKLSLAQAVRRMTSGPAARLGLQDRGIVREGMKADLVAFDPAAVGDRGTYQDPVRYPAGFSMTVVSGHVAMMDGELTGARAGGALRRR
jgi:N-acyl-D-amino-acid deacylase